ncbi:hypothetical protein [Nocardioides nitrophenolicus]|uniref:hypothetical protein n=1 Tax=Nocardioides nitrophenolicus TaxID=60489 RepID=UPI000AF0C7F9|nr:hypothetical protein [Nocardioides nitrophenolicus]MBM7520463.1 hypothetical protein [Nocardioides nitrophenolicus]
MDLSEPYQQADGLWCVSVNPGHADELLGALDPEFPFVLIETWDGDSDWHEAVVSVGPNDVARPRLVRHHSFDLLVTPVEARGVGVHLRAQGLAGGGLGCFQFRERPAPAFRVPASLAGRRSALEGQKVEIAIELPHDGEVAVVASPSRARLIAYGQRLA